MGDPLSCDTFVALPPATANGCVIFGKNSDRPADEVQEVVYHDATESEPGTKLQCTYIEIDQAPKTLAVILSKPAWMWGAEMGANEAGVCIGNEAVWTKLNGEDDFTERLLGMDLVRLGLERGATARKSLDVITSLLGQYGQGGTCYEDSKFAYHNSFIIADPSEAWVLETAGKFWAAEKVTAGVRNISNQLSITKMDLCSPNLIEEATTLGLYKPGDGEFSFVGVFGKDWDNKEKVESATQRFTGGRKLLDNFAKDGKFSARDMMKILRDVESGICMTRTTGSQVSVLSPGAGTMPCCHWLTATVEPNTCLFKPFIFGPHPDIGNSTISPDFGSEDPRKVIPRFQRTVDRAHDLYKGHEKLRDLLGKNDPTANMVLQNIKELENNCIGDIDEILASYTEESFVKVAGLFKHMCDIELNFYKMVHTDTGQFFEDKKEDGSVVRYHKIIQLPKAHVAFDTSTKHIELIDMLEEEGPPREAMEVEDCEEVLADGTVHTTHKVHTHAMKHIRKSVLSNGKTEDLVEERDVEVAGTGRDTLLETFTERPKSVTEIKEEEVLEDGTKVKRQVVLSSLVQKVKTRSKSFDDSGKVVSSDEYEIEEILPGTQSCFVAGDMSSSSSSSCEELEANIEETEETFVDGTRVEMTLLEAKQTRKSRSRSGSLERSEDTYTITERRITPSHTPRSGSPVQEMDDEKLLETLESASKIVKSGHYESTTHITKEAIETTSDLKTETFAPQGALKGETSGTQGPKSCDTFVALPPATANGCVIFGKNSDRPGLEVQEVIYRPTAEHPAGSKLQCTFIEIDQAPKTLAVILSKPAWMWGAEMGANEAGVCIGNEAVWTVLNSDDDLVERLLGMDLLRLGLERGSTARESVDVITSLLGQYGQGGTCMEGGMWSYHNSFIISDRSEAWVLETAGKYWAAERVTEGVRNISNELSITTKMDLKSPNLIEEATAAKLYNPDDGKFNFAKVFSEYYLDPALARSGRFGCGRRLLKEYSKDGTFGPKDMMKVLRDDDSGINMGSGTTGSQVSVITPIGSSTPCCHWLTATLDPSISMFKPFIFGTKPGVGKYTTSPDFGDDDPRKGRPRFKKKVDRRHELYKEQHKCSSLLHRGDEKGKAIRKNLQDLENNCIDDVSEILKNYEQNYSKVANLFDHMCEMEINFYKG